MIENQVFFYNSFQTDKGFKRYCCEFGMHFLRLKGNKNYKDSPLNVLSLETFQLNNRFFKLDPAFCF